MILAAVSLTGLGAGIGPASPAAAIAVVPTDVSAALGLGAGQLVNATLDGSTAAFDIRSTASVGFPTQGSSYVALSTGDVSEIDTEDFMSSTLGTNSGADGHDRTTLVLDLRPPTGSTCMSFDAMFGSEEFPEFVKAGFNDTFTAELGSSNLTYDTTTDKVVAPNNFAFDPQGAIIDVDTVFGVAPPPNTKLDGVTPTLKVTTPFTVDGSGQIKVFLSVQDIGDNIYDSVVFLDNLTWRTDVNCARGSALLVGSSFSPLVPSRILETRPGETPTVDGLFYGNGKTDDGGVLQLQVGGRGGVPANAGAAVLNITSTGSTSGGYVTAYPCDAPRPTAANLNYAAGQTIPNLVIAKLSATGTVCLYTYSATHLIADVNGYLFAGSSYAAISPARIAETRVGYPATVDGLFSGTGPLGAGQTMELQVGGRGGVTADAASAVMNIAVSNPAAPGFLTVWPCGTPRPTAANLNYVAGQTIPNLVNAKIGTGGKVCIYSFASTELIVDVNGFYRAGTTYVPISPARVLETRPGEIPTVDGDFFGIGKLGNGQTLELKITDRAGVPTNAATVLLNIAVTGSTEPGFLTVWPCGAPRPTAANLNYGAGETIPNLVIAKVGDGGKVCIYAYKATHVIADLNGYYPI